MEMFGGPQIHKGLESFRRLSNRVTIWSVGAMVSEAAGMMSGLQQ